MKVFRAGAFIAATTLLLGVATASAAPAISTAAIARVFGQIATSPALAGPSMILVDGSTGEIVFQKDATSLRKPASILKLLSTSAALEYLDPNYRYVTRITRAATPQTLVLSGNYDPWMTGSYFEATKYHRAWSQYLVNRSIADLKADQTTPLRNVNIEYSGIYSADLQFIKHAFLASHITATLTPISAELVDSLSGPEIARVVSPTISTMVEFALTWSDNLLAERLARAASQSVGFSMDDKGVAATISKLLTDLQVDQKGLAIYDGSGLSKQDRVTAMIMASLLIKIRGDARFAPIFQGLPISGKTGTLKSRYLTTAPQAVGLVHAKTGTLDGTVSLAGYVESGTHEYIFVTIADRIHKGEAAADQARATIDRLLGKIAAPPVKQS